MDNILHWDTYRLEGWPGLKWDKDQLKNRYDVLKMQYVTIKALLDQSDFDWDENTDIIMAKDDIWDNYIKEYPDAESMGSIGCPMYKHLCTTTFWATCPLFIYFFIFYFKIISKFPVFK